MQEEMKSLIEFITVALVERDCRLFHLNVVDLFVCGDPSIIHFNTAMYYIIHLNVCIVGYSCIVVLQFHTQLLPGSIS